MQSTVATAFNLSIFLIFCSLTTWTEGEAECDCFSDSSQGALESNLFIFHPDNLQKSFLDIVCIGRQNDSVGKGVNLKSEFRLHLGFISWWI